MALDLDALPDRTLTLLTERGFATLATQRPTGAPHAAVVGYAYDVGTHTAWLVLRGSGVKHANLVTSGGEQRVTLTEVAPGGRWITFEGVLTLVPGTDALAASLQRYRGRYGGHVGDDPTRVCGRLDVRRAYGTG